MPKRRSRAAPPVTRQARAPRTAINTGLPPVAPGVPAPRDTTRLELPHERDESLHATRAGPDPRMAQAAQDLAEGQVDTDLRNTPGLDARQRQRLLRRRP